MMQIRTSPAPHQIAQKSILCASVILYDQPGKFLYRRIIRTEIANDAMAHPVPICEVLTDWFMHCPAYEVDCVFFQCGVDTHYTPSLVLICIVALAITCGDFGTFFQACPGLRVRQQYPWSISRAWAILIDAMAACITICSGLPSRIWRRIRRKTLAQSHC